MINLQPLRCLNRTIAGNKLWLFALTGASAAQTSAIAQQSPNIIYILADDLGIGDLGCYGQQKIKTPNIDRMAREGMLFTQHYSGSTVSAPSRSALLTGMHTGHTPIRGNQEVSPEGQEPIPAQVPTMAQLLKEAGYATGAFGKWGLGYPGSEGDPNMKGFDEFYGYNCQRQAHKYYPEYLYHNQTRVELPENKNFANKVYVQDLIHQQAIQFIEDNKNKPFYAYLSYVLPHAELAGPNDSILAMYAGKFDEKPYKGSNYGYGSCEMPHAMYAAMVTRLDAYVGEVMDLLVKQGIDKNTIVIFTSDNGGHMEGGNDPEFFNSNAQFTGYKRDLTEGGIRTPMVAWWPQTIQAGSISNHISAFWDVLPTATDMAGIKAPNNIDGISMLPTLTGKGKQKKHQYLYWEFHEMGGKRAIRQGNWKAIQLNYGKEQPDAIQLYDLSKDEGEQNNVANQHPKLVKKLAKMMDQARTPSKMFNFGRKN